MPRRPTTPGALACVLALASWTQVAATPASDADDQRRELGREVFRLYCAECHGATGDGYGLRQDISYARPRSFQSARFKLATTENGVPSDRDLIRTIARGMPGSGMPNWSHLSDDELAAVAEHVRAIGVEAMSAALARDVEGGRFSREQADRMLAVRTVPGPPVEVPPEPPASEAGLRRGRELYLEACAACHGERGATPFGLVMADFDGNRLPPTSLRHGVFKGGAEGDQLYVRLSNGMDGTAMPGYRGVYGPEDLWHLVHYVQSLSLPGGSPVDPPGTAQGPAVGTASTLPGTAPPAPSEASSAQSGDGEPEGGRWLALVVAAAALCLVGLLLALGLGSAR
jgi:cytochrome c oxidase cbb3-type subunit I/II